MKRGTSAVIQAALHPLRRAMGKFYSSVEGKVSDAPTPPRVRGKATGCQPESRDGPGLANTAQEVHGGPAWGTLQKYSTALRILIN